MIHVVGRAREYTVFPSRGIHQLLFFITRQLGGTRRTGDLHQLGMSHTTAPNSQQGVEVFLPWVLSPKIFEHLPPDRRAARRGQLARDAVQPHPVTQGSSQAGDVFISGRFSSQSSIYEPFVHSYSYHTPTDPLGQGPVKNFLFSLPAAG